MKPVTIEVRLIGRLGKREWGLPSMVMPGQIWRSKSMNTVSCMLPSDDASKVRIETRPLRVSPIGELSWMPDEWRDALWEYVQAWPSSGCGLGPFLAISEEERCDLIRKLGERLVKSDNIGCRSIAHDIGQLAAAEYELPASI